MSKKRRRSGEEISAATNADDTKDTQQPATGASVPPPRKPSKTRRWRSRKRGAKATSVSGTIRKDDVASSDKITRIAPRWTINGLYGGKFGSKCIFSKDEKYLFAATEKTLKVLSVNSGQCVRSIGAAPKKSRIFDFILDPLNEFRVVLAYSTGVIQVFDWTDGLLINQCVVADAPKKLIAFGDSTLLLLTSSKLFATTLPFATLPKRKSAPIPVQFLRDIDTSHGICRAFAADSKASLICIAAGSTVHIGLSKSKNAPVSAGEISWKEINAQSNVTSLACRADTIAVGESSGDIHLYFGVSKSLRDDVLPTVSVINWHQSSVNALQLSVNGLYLLSGGAEDVLLISQTNTGNRQFVPRLGAEIVGLSETTSGSFYAASLSNNGIKIINAADLELKSDVSGIESPPSPFPVAGGRPSPAVAILHPKRGHLYINGSSSKSSAGTLQSFDITLDQQTLRLDIGRITHTKWTGKERRPVHEPVVTSAAFTRNGEWLATVDEWTNQYAHDGICSTEIFLKFWSWSGKQWELVTKIESPHGIDCRLFDVVSPHDQSALDEFATLGADGVVKIWRPVRRSHRTASEIIWALDRNIGSRSTVVHLNGTLKYSGDGSVLAVAVGNNIFAVDVSSSQIVKSLHVAQPVTAMEILGRYIICLHATSSLMSGWDIASGQVLFTDRIPRSYSTIAVNHTTSTFAIASASEKKSTIVISKLSHEGKTNEGRLSLDSTVVSLLSSESLPDASGFIFVDESGNVGEIGIERSESTSKAATLQEVSAVPTGPGYMIHRSTRKEPRSSGPIRKNLSIDDFNNLLGTEEMDITQMYEAIVQAIM